jgi:hypothetical protein
MISVQINRRANSAIALAKVIAGLWVSEVATASNRYVHMPNRELAQSVL